MKKCLLLLSVFTSIYSLSDEEFFEQLKQLEKRFRDPQYLKFVLSHARLDPKLYGFGVIATAEEAAKQIHTRLQRAYALASKKDFGEVGKSLDQELDAPIVNQCAVIEERRRTNGDFGTVQGQSHLSYFSGNYNGEIFFKNACPCDFYKNLTDEELHQLIEGTRPANKWFWPFN